MIKLLITNDQGQSEGALIILFLDDHTTLFPLARLMALISMYGLVSLKRLLFHAGELVALVILIYVTGG